MHFPSFLTGNLCPLDTSFVPNTYLCATLEHRLKIINRPPNIAITCHGIPWQEFEAIWRTWTEMYLNPLARRQILWWQRSYKSKGLKLSKWEYNLVKFAGDTMYTIPFLLSSGGSEKNRWLKVQLETKGWKMLNLRTSFCMKHFSDCVFNSG